MNCACKEMKKRNGKTVYKEGFKGTGHTLPFVCGFCVDSEGKVTHVFRTRRERLRHAKRCTR